MDNPAISVIIPTYNRKDILQKVLDAYKDQSLPQEQFEIIIIDDGSTDGTKESVAKASQTQPNIRYFHQPHGGPAKARNLGIEQAKGPIILFTGDDCIPDKHLLQEHLRLHKKGEAIAVLGHIDWHPDLEITPFMSYINIDTQFSYPRIKEAPQNVPFGYFYTSNISIPKKYFELVGTFDTDFTEAVWEDVELGYRIWKSGVRIVYNSQAITYHYHAVDIEDYIQRQLRAGKAAAVLYKKHPELIDFLRLPRVTSPEVRFRFYQALLDYYYFVGLQEALQSEKKDQLLLPLEDRLKNWSDIEKDRLMKEVHALERLIATKTQEIHRRDRQIHQKDGEIARRDGEIVKRDKLIEELHNKNQEKYYRIVELEKLEVRLKSSLLYRIYKLFRK
ncbi:MAG: glycosyltransferase [Candidatus Aureabacteria bacterium]|nr:glycosyltransferase [Candidatus Auribacterota bacterium]